MEYKLDFRDKVVLVTGAAQGMGRCIAVGFGSLGAQVVVDDIGVNLSKLNETADLVKKAGGKALPIVADITDTAEVEKMAEQIKAETGRVDVLINNAGLYRRGASTEFKESDWDKVSNTNIKAHFFVAGTIARNFMIPKKSGKIVFTSSTAAFFGTPGGVAYCVSKAAVLQISRALAVEWAQHNIQVNAIAPGYIATDFIGGFMNDQAYLDFINSRVPAKRIAQPEEVVGAVLFLCSPMADYITGAHIEIDGGRTACG